EAGSALVREYQKKINLLHLSNFDALWGHPAIGASWEGFIVENIIQNLSDKWRYSYYRSSTQAEIDLVLETPNNEVWAIEIKRSAAPVIKKSCHQACKDIGAIKKFVLYNGSEQFPMSDNTEAIGLLSFLALLKL